MGGGLCVYTINTLKVEYIENLSSVASDGFQQLRLQVQTRSCKSFLLNTVYRPPSAPVKFTLKWSGYLCHRDDYQDYEASALLEFCTTFGLTQCIN